MGHGSDIQEFGVHFIINDILFLTRKQSAHCPIRASASAGETGRPSYPERQRFNRATSSADTAMDQRNIQQEFQDQFNDVVSRLQSKQLFRSDWDIASFAVFFIFIGMVLLLVILVLIRCCCCCCCDDDKPRRRKVGIENMALEP
ncbi:hypothetical protein PAMA_009038 [Pampus argenteus]